jgi:hypothetical protein
MTDDPAKKRLLARLNDDLEWRSQRFRLGRKTYDLVELGELLANVRRRTGHRFKPALVPADPRDSDITDHGESSSEEEEEKVVEEKVGEKYFDNADHDESSEEEDEEEEKVEEKKVGDDYLEKLTNDDDEDDDDEKTGDAMDGLEIANELQRLKTLNGY